MLYQVNYMSFIVQEKYQKHEDIYTDNYIILFWNRSVSGGAIEMFDLLGVSILDPLLGTQFSFLVPANTKQNGDSVSFPPCLTPWKPSQTTFTVCLITYIDTCLMAIVICLMSRLVSVRQAGISRVVNWGALQPCVKAS